MEPLVIAFVWNRKDEEEVGKYVEYASKLLSRDTYMPFSRTINLPAFYYCNKKDENIPPRIKLRAETLLIYAFIGKNCVLDDGWDVYVKELYEIENAHVVPIALDRYAMKIDATIGANNFIRLYDFDICRKRELFLSMAHEIYRWGFNEMEACMDSDSSALKIFLSHTKEGDRETDIENAEGNASQKERKEGRGLVLAKQLKSMIDDTSMKRFFDTSDIAPGYQFNEVIMRNIDEASMIAINSDIYASRYWCQREIQQAKRDGRPVIEVDIISSGMDRKLPYAGNIPVVRIDMPEGKAKEEDLLRILEAILIETIRCNYAARKLERESRTLGSDVKIICRPPEMEDFESMIEKNADAGFSLTCDKIMYPDPPVYSEEIQFFEKNGVKVFTPIETPFQRKSFSGKSIGISVSEADADELALIGQDSRHTEHLSMTIANYVLGRGATLIYGGDLREGGYTERLILEAAALRDRLRSDVIHLKNYLAWPIYHNDSKKVREWKASKKEILQMVEIEIEEKAVKYVDSVETFVPPDTTAHRYAWASSLTKMRREMISECSARICAGGRSYGYKGKMPGVLEEILIAAEMKCPLYLLGGFGGVTGSVCRTIQTGEMADELTETWQTSRNQGYTELLALYAAEGEPLEYAKIEDKLLNMKLNNGLTDDENKILFNTVYEDEAMQLILKGLQQIWK